MPSGSEGDTARLLSAGAEETWLVGAGWAIRYAGDHSELHPSLSIAEILTRVTGGIVIVEGFKQNASWNILAVVRDDEELKHIGARVEAVICETPIEQNLPRFSPSDVAAIARFALTIAP